MKVTACHWMRALWPQAAARASFTPRLPRAAKIGDVPVRFSPAEDEKMVGALSIGMFVALVGFGAKYFGWSDPEGKVQLALATSFILGIIGGYKAKDS
jgi:hypothetical protein